MRWNLDNLYKSFDSKEFKNDVKEISKQLEDWKKWVKEVTLKVHSNNEIKKILVEFVNIKETQSNLVRKVMSFCSLVRATDSKNVIALKNMEKIQKKMIESTISDTTINKWIANIPNLEKIIDESDFLKEYKFILMRIVDLDKYVLDENIEEIFSKLSMTGADAWSKLQNFISSEHLISINEKKLPLPVVRNLAYHKEHKVRKEAYEAELESYKSIEEYSSSCLNNIKGEVLTTSKLRGYKSPLEKTLISSRMSQKSLDAMLKSIKKFLPVFHKYLKHKGKLLGYNNGLPFYELFAPIGESNLKYSYKEAQDFIINKFSTFSKELSDFASFAFKNDWIDAEPRKGKRGGAFCATIPAIKESRILSNFNGSFSNVTTLAHELGHGYHGFCLKDVSVLNSSYPMPLAETASIFCENIVTNAAMKNMTNQEKVTILEAKISDATQVICDIYSRFLFESKFFEMRENSSLTVDETKKIMLEAQKKAYGKGLDHKFLHPYMWLCKPHYYSSGLNYYNFPYSFGLLFSLGLYSQYKEEKDEFVEKYKKLLKKTGEDYVENVTSSVGIDITKTDFWESSLNLIKNDIEEFLRLT